MAKRFIAFLVNILAFSISIKFEFFLLIYTYCTF